jgi:membrane protease YdiL (CAAX protease family)
MLVLQFALGFTLAFAGSLFGDPPGAGAEIVFNPWVLGLLNILAIGAALGFGLRVTGEQPRRFFRVKRFDLTLLPAILLTSLGVAVVMNKVAKLFFEFARMFPQWAIEDISERVISNHPFGGFVLLVIIAPVTEEYLFRGMILRGLLGHQRIALAVLYSAILFGVMHANLLQLQVGLALGSVFGWWYARTRSTGPGLVGHAVFNAVAWFSAVLPGHTFSMGPLSGDEVRQQPAWLTLTALVAVALGILWFKERMKVLSVRGDLSDEVEAAPVVILAPTVSLAYERSEIPTASLLFDPMPPLLVEEPMRAGAIDPPPILEPPLVPPDSPQVEPRH